MDKTEKEGITILEHLNVLRGYCYEMLSKGEYDTKKMAVIKEAREITVAEWRIVTGFTEKEEEKVTAETLEELRLRMMAIAKRRVKATRKEVRGKRLEDKDYQTRVLLGQQGSQVEP